MVYARNFVVVSFFSILIGAGSLVAEKNPCDEVVIKSSFTKGNPSFQYDIALPNIPRDSISIKMALLDKKKADALNTEKFQTAYQADQKILRIIMHSNFKPRNFLSKLFVNTDTTKISTTYHSELFYETVSIEVSDAGFTETTTIEIILPPDVDATKYSINFENEHLIINFAI